MVKGGKERPAVGLVALSLCVGVEGGKERPVVALSLCMGVGGIRGFAELVYMQYHAFSYPSSTARTSNAIKSIRTTNYMQNY
jgi:hypothetical protein